MENTIVLYSTKNEKDSLCIESMFAGYDLYVDSDFTKKYRKLSPNFRGKMKKIAEKMPNIKGKQFFIRNGGTVEDSFIGQAKIFDEDDVDNYITEDYRKSISIPEIVGPYYDKAQEYDELTKKQYLDFHLWQPYDILLKADKMTMAHSLELRVPFLDKKVWELARRIPSKYKVRANTSSENPHSKCFRKSGQRGRKKDLWFLSFTGSEKRNTVKR